MKRSESDNILDRMLTAKKGIIANNNKKKMKLSDCGFSGHQHGFAQFYSKSEEGTERKMCANEARSGLALQFFFLFIYSS